MIANKAITVIGLALNIYFLELVLHCSVDLAHIPGKMQMFL